MTKSTITREESVQAVFDLKVGYRLGFADLEILKRVARMALAAMGSEPVAWLRNPDQGFHLPMLRLGSKDPNPNFVNEEFYPVYAAPQPAPVVPKEMTAGIAVKHWEGGRGSIESFVAGYNFCRATMLQASPVCTCPSGNGSLRWPCPVHPGNSPVIPDGYVMVPREPTKEMIDAGWLHYMGTKNPSSKGTYKAMLAAAPQGGER